jgi:tRNA threonylcarbamoyladenosine biosynthesis protein TsaB
MISRVLLADALLDAGAAAGPVLGLDTGTSNAYLGIVSGGRMLASVAHPAKSHGSDLPESVASLMGEAGLKFDNLAGIAVGIGPGSFTGLRVGLSYVKGIALATRIKVVGVPSLDVIALCAAGEPDTDSGATICPVIDARKGEVYTSLYHVSGDALERMTDDRVVKIELLIEELGGKVVFAGEAKAEEACEHFRRIGGRGEVVGSARLQLIGGFIAAIGAARVVEGDVEPIIGLEPRYVRPPDATVKHTALNPGEAIHGTTRGRASPAVCGK